MFSNFLPPKNRTVYELMQVCLVEPHMPHMTVKYWAEKMQLALQITKANIHTHSHNIWLLFHDWLITSAKLVKYFTAKLTKKRRTAHWRLCHYELFGQATGLRLNKALKKRTNFCLSAATVTLRDHVRTYCLCRRHNFAIKHYCAAIKIFMSWECHVAQQHIKNDLL
jgi:hypothetical protein